MPRLKVAAQRPDWDRLYEAAAAQAGYFLLSEADAAGFSPPLLRHHTGGRIEHVGRGIYRFRHFPFSQDDEFVPPWLWTGRTGVFSHETALQLHGLSDALPAHHHLTVPTSWRSRRLRVPMAITLHHGDLGAADRTWHGPVPVTTPLRTLLDCAAAGVAPDLLESAVMQAVARSLVVTSALPASLRLGAH